MWVLPQRAIRTQPRNRGFGTNRYNIGGRDARARLERESDERNLECRATHTPPPPSSGPTGLSNLEFDASGILKQNSKGAPVTQPSKCPPRK